jgi:hypothetical protein
LDLILRLVVDYQEEFLICKVVPQVFCFAVYVIIGFASGNLCPGMPILGFPAQ